MPPTIKDVAKKAGVSTATVSLVIHDEKRISPLTKRRVRKAIQELNYRPSRAARGLVTRRTQNIGYVLTEDHFRRTEPFYTNIFLGTEFEAREHDFYILVNTIPTEFSGQDCLPRFVKENNVDGIIIAGKVPLKLLECLEPYHLPIVFVDYYPPFGEHSAVLIDNLAGGRLATEELIRNGHKKIGFIAADMEHPSIFDRSQGYRMALEKNGIAYSTDQIITCKGIPDRESGYKCAQALHEKAPQISALFACNDAMAIGALKFFREAGVNVPDDISIIGFDDVTADLYSRPPLSSIRVQKEEMGVEAVRTITELINSKDQRPKKIVVPVELVLRESIKKIN